MPLPDIPQGIETQCNAALDALYDQLVISQPTYLVSNGKMFQGLRTHNTIPPDGQSTAPTKTVKPSDQTHNYNDVGITFPATIPVSLEVHIHESESGWSFSVVGTKVIAGTTYIKIKRSTGETVDWYAPLAS
jgi:hypothetical protein